MLDLKFIRENVDAVKANVKNRFMEADVDLVVELYTKYNETLGKLEDLRSRRNDNASKMKGKLSVITSYSIHYTKLYDEVLDSSSEI